MKHHQRPHSGNVRAGFSLLEVLLSMAILVGAIAVLGELMGIGMDNVEAARDRSRASVLAEAIMDQVLGGLIAAQASPEASVPEDLLMPDELNDNWMYTIELNTTSEVGMSALTVSVRQDSGNELNQTPDFTVTRWMIDPAIMDEMAAAQTEAETAAQSAATGGAP